MKQGRGLSRVAFYLEGKTVTWEDLLVGTFIISAGCLLGVIFLLSLIELEPRGASEDVLVVELRPVVVKVFGREASRDNTLSSELLVQGLIELGGQRIPVIKYTGSPSFGEEEPWYKCQVFLSPRAGEKIVWDCGRDDDPDMFESGEEYGAIDVAEKLVSYARRHR